MSKSPVDTEQDVPPSLRQSVLRSAIGLALFAILTAGLIAVTEKATKARIIEQITQSQLRSLAQIVAPEMHDNALFADRFLLAPNPVLGHSTEVEVYLAKRGGEPVAVILPVLAKEGYTGPIRLIVGIAPDGRILGVRVVEHKETPGLGDKIDIKKSDWILGFNGRSLGNPDQAGWQVKKDGGEFDALTGATITPRAVVKAVHAALMFFDTHQQQLTLAQPGQILHLETPHGTH